MEELSTRETLEILFSFVPRMPDRHVHAEEDLYRAAQPSEAIPTFLPFPGTEPNRPVRAIRG